MEIKKFEEFDNNTDLLNHISSAVPGDAPPQRQIHVFDFDDTLGKTDNANSVMPYLNGEPLLKDEKSALDWIKSKNLQKHLTPDETGKSIKKIRSRGGFAVNLTSGGLAILQSAEKTPEYVGKQRIVGSPNETDVREPGNFILIDFSPSRFVDQLSTKPISQTINKLKKVNREGGITSVMTARKGTGTSVDLEGVPHQNTNAEDIKKFLKNKGAQPTHGVIGVSGKNKGEEIIKKFSDFVEPEEIHFYDDLSKNTTDVSKSLKNPTINPKADDVEVFIYGPGDFEEGQANSEIPTKKIGKKK